MGLSNLDTIELVKYLQAPRSVFMRVTLLGKPRDKKCGMANFNKSYELASYWVVYYKNGDQRIYFDSFG